MDFGDLGFLRVGAVAPEIRLAEPLKNAHAILEHYRELEAQGCAVVLTPEMSLTGYSCEDLFHTADLQKQAMAALLYVTQNVGSVPIIVGVPLSAPDGRIFNCAIVCRHQQIVGAVPKSEYPNYEEFYETRWFSVDPHVDEVVTDLGNSFRLCRSQLFRIGDVNFAIEICEDLWAPRNPSIDHALAGASIVLNPSASTEGVAKAEYRRDLVRMQSAKAICAYMYAGSGPSESTKDVVFGGHLLAAENGEILGESDRLQSQPSLLQVDFDHGKLRHERTHNTTFANSVRDQRYRIIDCGPRPRLDNTLRTYETQPFVPQGPDEIDKRSREILTIQTVGLVQRLTTSNCSCMVIGLSGGLDSTLAFLVCLDAAQRLGWDNSTIRALTLPGPGTSEHTLESVHRLVASTGVELQEVSISKAVCQHLHDLGHTGEPDLTFENSQARERTQILFDSANQLSGLVVGTGDLSEIALGWSTFNADHMSGYNVNSSVPKTLVSSLVRWYAEHRASDPLRSVLDRILMTPISPELKPKQGDEIAHKTEELIGPYELHDFFLYHYLRTGADARKILILSRLAFGERYSSDELRHWLRTFLQRFFRQQFKRSVMPAGPKVGTVSLSPRGDWRMPDEAGVDAVVASLDDV